MEKPIENVKPDSEGLTTDELSKVISALENPDYDWRTFAGILAETHLTEDKLLAALNKLAQDGKIVQGEYPKQAYPVYTTVERYKNKNFIKRFQSAISDRVR